MAAAGTAGYAQDLVTAIKILNRGIGDHVAYGPLPNILLNGCTDEATVRTALEIGCWATHAFRGSDVLLHNSFRLVEEQFMVRGEGGLQTDYRCRLRLPTDGHSPGNTCTWSSGEWGQFSREIRPPSIQEERAMVEAIVEELRGKMAVDLCPEPIVDRWPALAASASGATGGCYLLVGSIHASKVGAALQRAGHEVDVIHRPNWRAVKIGQRCNVSELAEAVREKLKEKKYDIVCFLILDNNFYMALTEEGTTIPARRGDDCTYHMDGDLTVISKTAQHSLFNNLRPLLDACGGKSFILASPIPRYLYQGCCQDAEHMAKELMESLKDGARSLRDFLFTAGYKNGRILDSCRSLKDGETMWTDDPVHPTEAAYEKLAESVGMVAANIRPSGNKRRRDSLNSEQVAVGRKGGGGGGASGSGGGGEEDNSGGGKYYRDHGTYSGDHGGGSRSKRAGGQGVSGGGGYSTGGDGGRRGSSRGGGGRTYGGSSGPRGGRRF
jgi:hypothetical protein